MRSTQTGDLIFITTGLDNTKKLSEIIVGKIIGTTAETRVNNQRILHLS